MSQTDSFIDEVNEEVRRDRMNRAARKYGWIAVIVIVLGVGAAGINEWRKAQAQDEARTLGDAIYAALESDPSSRAILLAEISAEGTPAAIVAMLEAAELSASDPAEALARLEAVATRDDIPPIIRDAATLKQTMVPDVPLYSEEKLARLAALTAPGAPLRLLALEQMALVHVERGEREAAVENLRTVLQSAEASAAQRSRAGQVLIVLGEDLEGA